MPQTIQNYDTFTILPIHHIDQLPHKLTLEHIASKLVNWLGPWGDSFEDTLNALKYALSTKVHNSGFILLYYFAHDLVGILVMLDTGMEGYIPRHHLVYVAVEETNRGNGIGERLVRLGLSKACTAVSLHIDEENPARRLYKKIGFQNKYIEMRNQ